MSLDRSALLPGYRLPPFVRRAGFHNWNRYAAVNSEFVDIHMDDAAGQRAGYAGAIGMGNLTIAWLHAMLEEWMAGEGRVVRFGGQFRSAVLQGDTISCSATIVSVADDDGTTRVELELHAENERGEQLMPGRAEVELAPA
jgi:acyl dehydratase